MADKKVTFNLDLDIKNLTEKGLQAKGIIESIGSPESVSGLIDGLAKVSLALAPLVIAVEAFKVALDLTTEGEHLRKIEDQFDTLSTIAGVPGNELKAGLDKASAGLVDTTDLLESANKAIVKMGSSAAKLPEVMELARKATAVFGGNLKDNFDNITTAVANGNTRMLKQYGILVDGEKAVEKYAKANGLAVNEVSEVGRRQAILNEALAQGQKNFQGVSEDLGNATNTLQMLKVTVQDIGELFTLWFEKRMGPSVRTLLTEIKVFADDAKTSLTAVFGEGLSKNTAAIDETEKKLLAMKGELIDLQQLGEGDGFFEKLFKGKKEDRIVALNQDIAKTTQALETLRGETVALEAEENARKSQKSGALGGARSDESVIKQKEHEANEARFQKTLRDLKKATYDFELQNVNSLGQINSLALQQETFLQEEHAERVKEIRRNLNLTSAQQSALVVQENARYTQQSIEREERLKAVRMAALDAYVKKSETAFQGIGRSFQVMSEKNKMAMQDFGKRGDAVMTSFQTHSTYAFEKMGEDMAKGKNIAEAAADAMKGFFLNMLADRAIGEGQMLLLSGIWPPNPVALAAGAGLITLGGALRTMAGGSGGTVGGASGGGPGAPSGISQPGLGGPDTTGTGPDMKSMQKAQRTVAVNISGNYFETDASRRQLMEMMRQESDATGFNYNTIGAT